MIWLSSSPQMPNSPGVCFAMFLELGEEPAREIPYPSTPRPCLPLLRLLPRTKAACRNASAEASARAPPRKRESVRVDRRSAKVEAGSSEPQASGAVGWRDVEDVPSLPEFWSSWAQVSHPPSPSLRRAGPGLAPRGSVVSPRTTGPAVDRMRLRDLEFSSQTTLKWIVMERTSGKS